MTHDETTWAVREFLTDHPEHIQGVRVMEVRGQEEVMMDTTAVHTFADWCVRRGYSTPDKAVRMREMMAHAVRAMKGREG